MIANKQTDTQTHMPHISVGQQKKFDPPLIDYWDI